MSAWADDDRRCYETSLGVIERAARFIAARDRGDRTFGASVTARCPTPSGTGCWSRSCPGCAVGQRRPALGRHRPGRREDAALRVQHRRAAAGCAGHVVPDHFLRTKIKPLFVDWDPERADTGALEDLLARGLERYREDYTAYYRRCHAATLLRCRSQPDRGLDPGVGMIAWGKNKSESRVTAEFYNCAIEVMRGAEAIDQYEAMDEQEAFDIEYWFARGRQAPADAREKELERQVIVVVGAGNGIGKSLALAGREGGCPRGVRRRDAAAATRPHRRSSPGTAPGDGMAGTGLSGCGPAIGLACDITRRDSVQHMLRDVVSAYGGLDGARSPPACSRRPIAPAATPTSNGGTASTST